MELPERRRRHAALLQNIKKNNVQHWRETFLEVLKGCREEARA
jgi:trehalose-6-phosphate synthase